MALTKVSYSMIYESPLNLKDYGAVGNGVANDTSAWTTFIADCVSNNKSGFIPSGIYLIDSFTFTTAHQGLVLNGATANDGGSLTGMTRTALKLRSASATFITMDGARSVVFSNLDLDGGGFADVVLRYTGTTNIANTSWSNSVFSGATPNTGITHFYDGSNGGENCNFYNCVLVSVYGGGGATKVLAHIRNINSNAFLGSYHNTVFQNAHDIILFEAGSSNLYDCQFYGFTNAAITVKNTCQAFTATNAYNEQDPSLPFFRQVQTAGVSSDTPIIFINPQLNSVNTAMNLNCQQSVFIYGGRIPQGFVDITPNVPFGVIKNNIVDGTSFNTSFGISGTGALTHCTSRGVSINQIPKSTNLLVTQISDLNVYQTVQFAGTVLRLDVGASPNISGVREIRVQNTAPQNVTSFTGGVDGQEFVVIFSDSNTTLVQSGTLKLANSINYNPTSGSNVTFRIRGGGAIFQEICRTPA
tara:strand:- start:897 stop:2312 length:1416 start_codon:yes stop_codon:yes gene_type:complete